MERRTVNPWTWQEQFGFHQANEVSGPHRTLHLAGQTSLDANGQVVHEGDMAAQIDQCITNMAAVLAEAGMDLAHVVHIRMFTIDVDEFIASSAVLGRLNAAGCEYASTLLGVTRLAFPELLVELEATAVAP